MNGVILHLRFPPLIWDVFFFFHLSVHSLLQRQGGKGRLDGRLLRRDLAVLHNHSRFACDGRRKERIGRRSVGIEHYPYSFSSSIRGI